MTDFLDIVSQNHPHTHRRKPSKIINLLKNKIVSCDTDIQRWEQDVKRLKQRIADAYEMKRKNEAQIDFFNKAALKFASFLPEDTAVVKHAKEEAEHLQKLAEEKKRHQQEAEAAMKKAAVA